jgi:hypothetical protein
VSDEVVNSAGVWLYSGAAVPKGALIIVELRRSVRILASVPVDLYVNADPPQSAVTAVINRHGALLLSPVKYDEGTIVWIRNQRSLELVRAQVVWLGPQEPPDLYRLGVGFIDEHLRFWGNEYDSGLQGLND